MVFHSIMINFSTCFLEYFILLLKNLLCVNSVKLKHGLSV